MAFVATRSRGLSGPGDRDLAKPIASSGARGWSKAIVGEKRVRREEEVSQTPPLEVSGTTREFVRRSRSVRRHGRST